MWKFLREKDIIKVIISSSEMNQENQKIEYRIDISYYLENKKNSFYDTSYSISGKTARNIFLEDELLINIKAQMQKWGITKYSIIKTEVNTIEGYGRQIIKIERN